MQSTLWRPPLGDKLLLKSNRSNGHKTALQANNTEMAASLQDTVSAKYMSTASENHRHQQRVTERTRHTLQIKREAIQ